MHPDPKHTAVSDYLYRRTAQIADNPALTPIAACEALRRLLLELFERATADDNLHFSTSYARISFVAHKHQLPRDLVVHERQFRRGKTRRMDAAALDAHLTLGLKLAVELTAAVFGTAIPDAVSALTAAPFPAYRQPEIKRRYYQLRVLATAVDSARKELTVRVEQRAEQVYVIPYGAAELADTAVPTAARIIDMVTGPFVVLNLINAQVHDDGYLYPTQIVIEPDYLVNVTDVAACFGGNDASFQPWSSLPKRLIPFEKRPPLVRGNIVNTFLDVLIQNPETSFHDVRSTIFEMQPLELCTFTDEEVRRLVVDLKHHFVTVQKFVRELLPELDIDRDTVTLEPSFLSPAYGLQGRLDLLESQKVTEDSFTSIVELKTSKIFRPNRHGIRSDNFIQTLLYDLMINQALGKEANVRSYILYSVDYDKPVRYAPPEFMRQMEALTARNQLVALEALIAQLGRPRPDRPPTNLLKQTDALFGKIRPHRFKNLGSYTERDHITALSTYDSLTELERCYFGAFMGFVAREQRLAKIGEQKTDHVNGLASLWLDDRQDKLERFELLDGLTFSHYSTEDNLLMLARDEATGVLSKFRQGDIVALYGTDTRETLAGDAVKAQVFKSTIVFVGADALHLRPRNPQLSDGVFRRKPYWAVEKDVMDSSFRNYYLGLYLWAASPPEWRQRWLGLRPPGQAAPHPERISYALTDEQDRILGKIVTAPDYFLLWGPPGTGKTSQMLHHLVRYLLEHTEENILLVAYTNRAVDEICESIERIEIDGEPFRNYLRIGSRLGTGEDYTERLLQLKSKGVQRRRDLRAIIDESRIVVGTVASVGGKNELFKLKSFDRIVVDEASQILEPLLGAILTRAPRSLLIGDHRQLPAVVQQGEVGTKVEDESLNAIGLSNLGTSFFERLYLRAKEQQWTWAYDKLKHQGRMHTEIMAFPALHFYDRELEILPTSIPHHLRQLAPLALGQATNALQEQLALSRLVFLTTEIDRSTPDPKVNGHEAAALVRLVEAFTQLYADTDAPIKTGDIGIITPYRAQIAYVRQELERAGYVADDYTVDTVERYQGSAKRIILMSLCTNSVEQVDRLSQLSDEGVDRKLNVAMTRAREHLVLVGCPDVLKESPVYAQLLGHIEGALTLH